MTKEEIYTQLLNSGQWKSPKNTPLWQAAFELYNSNQRRILKMSCPRCFKKVWQWLKKQNG